MPKDFFSKLNSKEKKIIVDKGTELPFSGKYNDFFKAGIFICRACKNPLFESSSKFNSSCGWPSFDEEIEGSIVKYDDFSGGRIRTEICCKKCDGHLGHVFKGEKMTVKDTRHCVNSLSIQFKEYKNLKTAYFAGGCFWNIEKLFNELTGVYLCHSGYMGGKTKDPTYDDVSTGLTNHAETVKIYFDENDISYIELLRIFYDNHNPTTLNAQGNDVGTQYRSIIFYSNKNQKLQAEKFTNSENKKWNNKIVTEIIPSQIFYRAEEFHQNYLNKNNLGTCGI
tara:strand:- start:22490 stop:23332 length:843 start_codon:yes stop_codon:yes gene_type:complete